MTNTVFEYKWQGLAQIIFPAGFAGQGVLNKDPNAWLDGAIYQDNWILIKNL
jgi:hypothetical protein